MSNKKEEPNAASQRIASLSKDPDNSPSSRSSTSSWYFFVIIKSAICKLRHACVDVADEVNHR